MPKNDTSIAKLVGLPHAGLYILSWNEAPNSKGVEGSNLYTTSHATRVVELSNLWIECTYPYILQLNDIPTTKVFWNSNLAIRSHTKP